MDYWTGSARLHLWILLAASVLMLAASVLSAGILIVSGVLARAGEIATRIALGATRSQILAQLGAESALIAAISAIIGTGLSDILIRCLVRLAPANIPRLSEAGLNTASIGFVVVMAAIAAAVCALMPRISATRMPLDAVLRESGTRLSLSRRSLRLRNIFVLGQMAATVVVLSGAALFVFSYRSMMSADIGFENRDALSVNLQLRGMGLFASQAIDPRTRHAFYEQLLNRVRETPGVTSAAAVLLQPLEGVIGWERGYEFAFEAGRKNAAMLPKANYEAVTPGYFQTVRTPLLEGRDFDEHDSEDGEAVGIISRKLAGRIRAAGYAPIGHRVRVGGGPEWLKIVGVCADARYRTVTQEDATIFQPYRQAAAPTHYVVIRGTRSAHELGLLVRRTLARMDPNQAVAGDATIGELMDANTARHRFNMILLLCFAACSALLSGMGVYGVIRESVTARKREVAIRMALGAPRIRALYRVVSGTLGFVVMGEAIGMCAMAVVHGEIAAALYGVQPYIASLFGAVALIVFGVALGASLRPAWSAVDQDSIDIG